MVGDKIWSRGMGIEGMKDGGKYAGKIHKMDIGGGLEDPEVHGEGEDAKEREKAKRRAGGFEERLEKVEGSKLARRCWGEIKDRTLRKEELSDWERGRMEFFEGSIETFGF